MAGLKVGPRSVHGRRSGEFGRLVKIGADNAAARRILNQEGLNNVEVAWALKGEGHDARVLMKSLPVAREMAALSGISLQTSMNFVLSTSWSKGDLLRAVRKARTLLDRTKPLEYSTVVHGVETTFLLTAQSMPFMDLVRIAHDSKDLENEISRILGEAAKKEATDSVKVLMHVRA